VSVMTQKNVVFAEEPVFQKKTKILVKDVRGQGNANIVNMKNIIGQDLGNIVIERVFMKTEKKCPVCHGRKKCVQCGGIGCEICDKTGKCCRCKGSGEQGQFMHEK